MKNGHAGIYLYVRFSYIIMVEVHDRQMVSSDLRKNSSFPPGVWEGSCITELMEGCAMIVSTKGRYALRIMLELAMHEGEGYLSLKEISTRQNVSMKYLEQIRLV